MQDILNQIKERQERAKNFLKQEAEVNKNLLSEAVKQIFEENKEWLTSFSWTQYTPYFNDGDTCEFEVNLDWSTKVNGKDIEEVDFLNEFSGWGKNKKENLNYDPVKVRVIEDLKNLITSLGEETLKSIFGDHVQVTLTENGFESEEYEHD